MKRIYLVRSTDLIDTAKSDRFFKTLKEAHEFMNRQIKEITYTDLLVRLDLNEDEQHLTINHFRTDYDFDIRDYNYIVIRKR